MPSSTSPIIASLPSRIFTNYHFCIHLCIILYIPLAHNLNAAETITRYVIQESLLDDGTQRIILKDNTSGIEASIVPTQGGELSSLRVNFHGQWQELLFRALDYKTQSGWRGKAPLLWPAVGRNFAQDVKPDGKTSNCSYDYNGKRYEIPIHGFIRHKTWRVASMHAGRKGAEVDLVLTDDEATRKQYPFGFVFHIIHRISKGSYTTHYRITASTGNQAPMFFSIGNHITFRVPFIEGSPLSSFMFETPLSVQYLTDENSVPTGNTQSCSFSPPKAVTEIKKNTAISLGGFTSGDPWVKLTDPAGLSIRISHNAQKTPELPYVQFNIWGSADDGYFSPEPWIGLQNSLNLHQGLIYLPSCQSWRWDIKVEFESKE